MFKDPDDVEAKFGRDDKLETEADKWLSEGVRDNARSLERDIEKMSHEAGTLWLGEAEYYDPLNDWDTQDSAYAILMDDLSGVEPTICADVDDGNSRARNRTMQERQKLMEHLDENADWGSTRESVPLLGANDGPRKVCTKCGKAKGLQYFYAQPRNKDGLSSWCKNCQKSINSRSKE